MNTTTDLEMLAEMHMRNLLERLELDCLQSSLTDPSPQGKSRLTLIEYIFLLSTVQKEYIIMISDGVASQQS